MKLLILISLLIQVGCSQKYKTYPVIEKSNFNYEKPLSTPITKKLYRTPKKEVRESCEGQVFWNRNAQKINIGNIPSLMSSTCSSSPYLMDSKITETWWTSIIYSKSCIKLESYCPRQTPKRK